jgi:phage baseplate assembly protein W
MLTIRIFTTMLSAQLSILGTILGSGQLPNQVVVGLVIEEDDMTLPHRYVAGTLAWGDGTTEFDIAPQTSPYNSVSTIQLTQKVNVVTLTLAPKPYKGTFELTYQMSTNTAALNFDATAAAIQSAITAVLGVGESVNVLGSAPQWTLTFDSQTTASKFTAGPDTLFGPVVLSTHLYANGNFLLNFTVHNYRSPVQDVVEINRQLSLSAGAALVNNQPVLIGPILPADVGTPNSNQWNFNISTDLQVLVSNIKMILIVEPGERLMMPEYGTGLRQFIFEPMDGMVNEDIETEIRRAVETWEPRVSVDSIGITKVDQRTLAVQVIGTSKLDQERFQLNVELER